MKHDAFVQINYDKAVVGHENLKITLTDLVDERIDM